LFGGNGGTEFQDQKLGIVMQGLSLMASLPVYASVPVGLLYSGRFTAFLGNSNDTLT
jgi:hypothetical protein